MLHSLRMTTPGLIERLASLPTLSGIPHEELAWLAAHGTMEVYEAGTLIAERDKRIEHLWILFSGSVPVSRDTPAGPRRVMEWGPGEVTGRLPYSRMTTAHVDIRLDRTTETLTLHERHVPDMIRACPEFTAYTVHLMVDRAREFKTSELQVEKLASLGRLAAGLAHELNNPASATVRGAVVLREGLSEAEAASRALAAAGLSEASLTKLDGLRAVCLEVPGQGVRSPLEQADRENELEDWLADHGCDPDHAASLAETSVTLEALDGLAREITGDPLGASLRWLAASCTTHSVATDIERTARRIHELVAAVKRFTYMDNLASPDSVDVRVGLRDTVTVLAAKARAKGASIRLDLAPDLPPVRATGGELNQVWMNLIDNALDAIAESGHVEIGAQVEQNRVVVRVTDDGPGIPEEVLSRIFDPFFTTKAPGEGTGLGLDIARRLVSRHRGEIDVESRPGRTMFRVRLVPDVDDPGAAAEGESE
jgi:signal transduction histidine kinase